MKHLFAFFAVFAGSQVQAHSGHDHSHWLSDSIHFLTFVAIASLIAVAYEKVKNRPANKVEKK